MSSKVFYILTDGASHSDPLAIGRTIIGRSAAPVDGVAFICLESPRGAISRLQAAIDVAPNGDAWISDCESTNGTFLACRPGPGVRLEPNHYYQLTAGCRVVFGDVERQVVAADATTPPPRTASTSVATAAAGSNQEAASAERKAGAANREPATASPLRTSLCATTATTTRTSPTAADLVPYLAHEEEHECSTEEDLLVTVQPGRKRPRVAAHAQADVAGVACARYADDGAQRRENISSKGGDSSTANAGKLRVCISGMDADQREATRRAVRRHGGTLVEDVLRATVLVVPTPATRTPKLIIAVGRGIPVVSQDYLNTAQLDRAAQERYIVPVTHDRQTYTSEALRRVIFRDDRAALLQGTLYNLARLPARARRVAEEVIVGCGGQVTRRKTEPGRVLDEESVSELYDHILRGDRTRATGKL